MAVFRLSLCVDVTKITDITDELAALFCRIEVTEIQRVHLVKEPLFGIRTTVSEPRAILLISVFIIHQ
jgi:hypothetical protein